VAILDRRHVTGTTHDVIPDSRHIPYTTSTDQDNGVFQDVMPFSRDVGGHFDTARKPHASYRSPGRVRLAGRADLSPEHDPSELRTLL
jgi:hypothetical protein